MLWVPQKGRVKQITNGGIVGTVSPGTAITANATTLLDGAVTEFISAAANDQDSWGIHIMITADVSPSAVAAVQTCLDILIGGATDDVLIPALICGGTSTYSSINYFFPLHIPQGKRIAGILASAKVSMAYRVQITLYGGSPPPWRVGQKVTALGTQANNARGQAVVPTESGGAASVTQMVASSVSDYFAFMPGFQTSTDATMSFVSYNIGIGIGASVEDRIGTWTATTTGSEEHHGPFPAFPIFQDVPAGSRISLLASNSGLNNATYDALIYGVN
ncbi:MAG: hypothetical protein H0W39_01050 [Sphingomonas sp.]|nr:hypothetical protein [Sphingomonas sp.]